MLQRHVVPDGRCRRRPSGKVDVHETEMGEKRAPKLRSSEAKLQVAGFTEGTRDNVLKLAKTVKIQ